MSIYALPGLINKVGQDFVDAFRHIPRGNTILDLSNSNLGAKRIDDIIAGLALIADTDIIMINFRDNELFKLSGEALLKIMQSIPNKITSLILAKNKLNSKAGRVLTELLYQFKPSIRFIDLSDNSLAIRPHNRTSSQTLMDGQSAIIQRSRKSAGDVTQRAIASTGMHRLGSQVHFFIPGAIETYEVGPEKAAASLESAFKKMSSTITALDLSFNSFYHLPGALLAKVFSSFPLTMKTLKFRGNGLGTKSINDTHKDFSKKRKQELIKVFTALKSKSIYLLCISDNDLHNLTPRDLMEVIFSIPPQIIDITLSKSDLEQFSNGELVTLVTHLQQYNKVLKLIDNQGSISSIFRRATVIDEDLGFIPSMFSKEQLRARKVPFTLEDANFRANSIYLHTMGLLIKNLGFEGFNVFMEYLNISLWSMGPLSLNMTPSNALPSVTRTSLSPTPSPLVAAVTAALSPSDVLQIELPSPCNSPGGGSGSSGKPAALGAQGANDTAAVSASKYSLGAQTIVTKPDESRPEGGSSWLCCS